MWEEISALFTDKAAWTTILFLVGIALWLIRVFSPDFGVFGLMGIIISITGFVWRCLVHNTLVQFLFFVVLFSALLMMDIITMILVIKGKFKRKNGSIVERKTAVPIDYVKDDKALTKLIGKVGFAETDFKPIGRFIYNGESYQAISKIGYVTKGEKIIVTEVDIDKIYVKSVK